MTITVGHMSDKLSTVQAGPLTHIDRELEDRAYLELDRGVVNEEISDPKKG